MKKRRPKPDRAGGGADAKAAPVSQMAGVRIEPLARHDDARGWLTELFRADELPGGEAPAMAYVSATRPGAARGPHEHVRQTDIFCFLGPGTFAVYLWDNRRRSKTFGRAERFELGADCPARLTIPPGVVHGYRNISRVEAVCFNAPNRLYRGRGKRAKVDEIRHEADPASPFRME